VDELDIREKRGLTKDQKEERDHGRKVLDFLKEGTDVRWEHPLLIPSFAHHSPTILAEICKCPVTLRAGV
jgi:hypothetical protein